MEILHDLAPSLTALRDALRAGETVLVPGAAAAGWLRSVLLADNPFAPGWGRILAWSEWTQTLWAQVILEGQDDRGLLNRLQEEQLWTTLLPRALPEGVAPVSPQAVRDTVPLARAATQRACAFRFAHRLRTESDSLDSIDCRSLALAWGGLRERCERERLLPAALLEEELAHHAQAGHLADCPPLVLAGFLELTPAQNHLLEACRAAAIPVNPHELALPPGPLDAQLATTLADDRARLSFAVRYVAQEARAGRAARIALITENADEQRGELEALFRAHIAPELQRADGDLSAAPWSFASPGGLSASSLARDALGVVRWTVEPLSLGDIRHLLLSPYGAAAGTTESLAGWARRLGNLAFWKPTLTLAAFLDLSPPPAAATVANPAAPWRALLRAVDPAAAAGLLRPVPHWTAYIQRLLEALGWPGGRALNAAEFRALQAWQGLLDGLATLQLMGIRLSFRAVLDLIGGELARVAAGRANPSAPLQVLSLEQAEGQLFDLAIVLDASDEVFPAPLPLNPLLPVALQREFGFGESRQATDRGRRQLTSLTERSRAVLLLTADQENAAARLTPLGAELGFQTVPADSLLPALGSAPPVPLEPVPEADALPPLPSGIVFGGARVLEDQAACGFRAFAHLRLRSEAPEPGGLGMDARTAGSILHAALQVFWQGVQSHANLQGMTGEERRAAAGQAIAAALQKEPPARGVWDGHYVKVLSMRFLRLLERWLELELARAPFEVATQEQERELELGPLRLKLRPDRIDRVAGGLVFVDYKTSAHLALSHWEGERLEAPQLPAYALTEPPEEVRGIAFAQIRPAEKQRGWIGLAAEEGIFPKRGRGPQQVELTERLTQWRSDLQALATAFAEGDVRVHPRRYPDTCTFCRQRPLCRLDPASLLLLQDDEEKPEDNDG